MFFCWLIIQETLSQASSREACIWGAISAMKSSTVVEPFFTLSTDSKNRLIHSALGV